MRQTLSFTARSQSLSGTPEEVPVLLMQFEHASLPAPVRVSSDPTERLQDDPPLYGTRSTWNSADPATEPYLFLSAGFVLPGDQEDAPAAVQIVLNTLDAALITSLRSVNTRATAHLALVLASAPNLVQIEYRGLQVLSIEYGEQLTITASRQPIEEEAVPKDRFTKDRFPGLIA